MAAPSENVPNTSFANTMDKENKIKDQDYVILKKDDFLKLVHVDPREKYFWLGKQRVALGSLAGFPYGSVYEVRESKLIPVNNPSDYIKFSARNFEESELSEDRDNREIVDDGTAQKLSKDDIQELKKSGLTGTEIVDTLVGNCATFQTKTEFSQAKYLKKKRKKYMQYMVAMKPTVQLLAEFHSAQNPQKVQDLRPDYLAQILSYANVQSGGRYIVSENCKGLVVAAIVDRLDGQGVVAHVAPDGAPTPHTYKELNLTAEELCEIYYTTFHHIDKNSLPNTDPCEGDDKPTKKRKKYDTEEGAKQLEKRQEYKIQAQKALDAISDKEMDGLIVASKYNPTEIVQNLIDYVGLSRPIVVYSICREPLIDCYQYLRERGDVAAIRLSETWCRTYQVLPKRTHPSNNMVGPVGYLLYGYKIQNKGT